ncbi:MAG: Phosphoenolpyruvate synthase, partial [candidate division CPR2 bacterium GW2011_GWD1_39_7]
NEYRNLPGGEDEPHEENPMIGYRGCFRYMKEPELFNMELEAIKKVRQNNPNLHLMIPFVRRIDEFMAVKKLVEDAGLRRGPDFKLWIMVEVPSTVFLIDKFIDCGIDGISIGSNDLTQLILGLDRDSSVVAEEYDERNEAVQIALKRIIEVCRERGVTASICGQAPSVYPEITEKLVEYGVTSVSVSPDVIESTRRLIASVEEKLLLRELSEVRKNFHI